MRLPLRILLGLCCFHQAIGYAADRAGKKYNVLFIAIDDLRTELSIYGKPVVTPNFEGLAKSGTVFERAYCQQALCMPSRASLLTGRRPDTTKVYDFNPDFRAALPGVVTLPQHFKEQGYHTQAFGKIFHEDDKRAWTVPLFRSKKPEYHTEKGRKVLEWIKEDWRRITFTWDLGNGVTKSKRMGGLPWEAPDIPDHETGDGDINERAIRTLREIKDKPFFLAVGYFRPHLPFVAPKRYFDMYDRDEIKLASNPYPPKGVPEVAMYNWNDMRHYYGVPKVGPMPEEMSRDLKHAYYASVTFVDTLLGQLIDELERLKLRDKTIIIVWGDHGWQLGEHGMWDKHSNFETSTHVPLIISVPGQKSARCKAFVEFVDIYPTLADLCGLPLPEGLEGTSFAPLIDSPEREWKSAAFSQHPRVVPGYGYGMGRSMRTERYRFTEWTVEGTSFQEYELYDHEDDPDENVNVAGRSENRELVEKLKEQLHAGWQAAVPGD